MAGKSNAKGWGGGEKAGGQRENELEHKMTNKHTEKCGFIEG
jgi:hypothetical protein